MRHGAFHGFCSIVGFAVFAQLDALFQAFDAFIDVRIPLHVFLRHLGMLESNFRMLNQDIGVALLPMLDRFVRMLDRLGHMLIAGR